MSNADKTSQLQLQRLIDLDISSRLEPEQRLALAILRQAVLDYFGDNPDLKQSSAAYFAESALYRLTLRMFRLPDDLLPIGVDLGRPGDQGADEPMDLLKLETLVNELSGTQLKVMLTLGLLELPATAGSISAQCRLNRGTVISALAKLAEQGLVTSVDTSLHTIWTVPAQAQRFLDQLWAAASWAAADRDTVDEEITLSLLPDELPGGPEPAPPADTAAE